MTLRDILLLPAAIIALSTTPNYNFKTGRLEDNIATAKEPALTPAQEENKRKYGYPFEEVGNPSYIPGPSYFCTESCLEKIKKNLNEFVTYFPKSDVLKKFLEEGLDKKIITAFGLSKSNGKAYFKFNSRDSPKGFFLGSIESSYDSVREFMAQH